jgi:adenosylcobinamide kinase / adenosylcobinamide-phosphate guanylyltransferase
MPAPIVVTGPTRSGKSEFAERLAMDSNAKIIYIATSTIDPQDEEWQARIQRHRDRRPREWETRQMPLDVAEEIRGAKEDECLLIDSLGGWVANYLHLSDADWTAIALDLLEALALSRAYIICVAEEVGWGVVPSYQSGRVFCDRLGDLVRSIGKISSGIYIVAAGYAIDLTKFGVRIDEGF